MKNGKILFIGHSYHKKTGSSKFMEELLQERYEVECMYDESWLHPHKKLSVAHINLDDYHAIILWQIAGLLPNEFIRELSMRNTVFFPMENYEDGWNEWKRYTKFKIISFSDYNYRKLRRWGFDVQYYQYYPRPKVVPAEPTVKPYTVFFWQRVNALSWETVKKLFNPKEIGKVFLHRAVDPGHQFVMPSEADIKKFNIEITEWFDDKAELERKIAQADIYISPRVTEGIGFSFLEAMAMGKAVIAVDKPTMNEYIEHKNNGYLFDIDNLHRIDLSTIDAVREKCKESVERGFEKWELEKSGIFEVIDRRYSPDVVRLHTQMTKDAYRKVGRITKRVIREASPFFVLKLKEKLF